MGVWFVFWFNQFAGLLFDCSVLLLWRCDYDLLMTICNLLIVFVSYCLV